MAGQKKKDKENFKSVVEGGKRESLFNRDVVRQGKNWKRGADQSDVSGNSLEEKPPKKKAKKKGTCKGVKIAGGAREGLRSQRS